VISDREEAGTAKLRKANAIKRLAIAFAFWLFGLTNFTKGKML
jgi:hypothetical protein